MKKRLLALFCIITLLVTLCTTSVFASTPSAWAAEEIANAQNAGLVTESVSAAYQANITREQFCELAVLLYEKLTGTKAVAGENKFADTANPEILKAYALGIVNGVSETEFAPYNSITRQEMCVMLVRSINAILGDAFALTYDAQTFADDGDIAPWAYAYVQYAYGKGIIRGVDETHIAPLGTATCEQAVIMVYRISQNIDACKGETSAAALAQYENYKNVNNTFSAIERIYLDETACVPPEKLGEVLGSVYQNALQMQSEGEIQNVTLNEDIGNVCVVLKNGAKYIYAPPVLGLASSMPKTDVTAVNNVGFVETEVLNSLEGLIKNSPKILLSFNNPWLLTMKYRTVNLEQFGNRICETIDVGSYKYMDNNPADINALKNYLQSISTNNRHVFLWRGHGNLWDSEVTPGQRYAIFQLNYQITPENISSYEEDINTERIVYYNSGCALTPKFFETYLPKVNGGIFYSGSCYSAADGGIMADAILSRGFDCYIGSSESIMNIYSDMMMDSVVKYLCSTYPFTDIPYTVEEALLLAQLENGKSDLAVRAVLYALFVDSESLYEPLASVVLSENSDGSFALGDR